MPKLVDIQIVADNVQDAIESMKKYAEDGFMAIGEKMVKHATDECPVDTGTLRNSISWATEHGRGGGKDKPRGKPESMCVYVGTNVEYAVYVEYCDYHHNVGNKHFLKNALTGHNEEYRKTMEAALKVSD